MRKVVLLGTTALVTLSLTGAVAAPSRPAFAAQVRQPKQNSILPHRNASLLYDQSSGSHGFSVLSQNFLDEGFSIYDSNGADDFPPLGSATITEVVANGLYFDGSGPADSYDVILYKKIKVENDVAVKVKVQAVCPNQSYTDLNGFGYPDIKLRRCLGKTSGFDKGGWVAVIANQHYYTGGQWRWNTNNKVKGSLSVWRSMSGCDGSGGNFTYITTLACLAIGEGGDFAFALYGHP